MSVAPAEGKRVLVVDDEPGLLRLVARVLERAGHRVETAADGDRALEALRRSGFAFDLALIDLSVRPAGGVALMRALRAERPGARVLLSSGGVLDPALREELHASEGSFLHKPFSPRSLSAAVARVLAGESFPDGFA